MVGPRHRCTDHARERANTMAPLQTVLASLAVFVLLVAFSEIAEVAPRLMVKACAENTTSRFVPDSNPVVTLLRDAQSRSISASTNREATDDARVRGDWVDVANLASGGMARHDPTRFEKSNAKNWTYFPQR